MNKTLEDRAKEHANKYDLETLNNKSWVYLLIKECFIAGYKERDTEVQELKDVILEMSEELKHSPYADAYWLLDKHAPLIERLKKEREG